MKEGKSSVLLCVFSEMRVKNHSLSISLSPHQKNHLLVLLLLFLL